MSETVKASVKKRVLAEVEDDAKEFITKTETVFEEVEAKVAEVIETVVDKVEMVIVSVPKAFKLRIDNFKLLEFKPGIQKVEKSIADHWYALANGMKIFKG